ncbi:hypothetical protein A9C19_03530 [Bacillus weihaiensis]|uniref:Uncharacterized protein n=1 Tax=Bacillus weihaiensis TaxID=1547283 RepID=A0A1L3MNI4_9BACI|nr:hypothetical protein A9C19_03530 [Bacillus weihaiensis]
MNELILFVSVYKVKKSSIRDENIDLLKKLSLINRMIDFPKKMKTFSKFLMSEPCFQLYLMVRLT